MSEGLDHIWTLFEISEIGSDGNITPYLHNAMRKCATWFRAAGASLFIRDDDGRFSLNVQAGADSNLPADATIENGKGIAGEAIARGEPLLLNGSEDSVLLSRHRRQRKRITSSIVMPLKVGGEIVGVLNLSRTLGQLPFSDADLNQVQTVARQIALAVSNAQLIQTLLQTKTIAAEQERELARVSRLAEIGQMTAAVAHEVRNPLTGISSAAQMIKSAPETADEFAELILVEVEKLKLICEEFLEFARPVSLRLAPVQLTHLVSNLLINIKSLADERQVQLVLENSLDQPIIHLDALKIEQALRNLIQNAVQSCSRGGTVSVRIDGRKVVVKDTGSGIKEENLTKLFTPFFTSKSNGTGLGLCNVKKIIDAHHGEILVESRIGEGSIFTVELGAAA